MKPDVFLFGMGAMFVALVLACAIGIYAHLIVSNRRIIENIKERRDHALEHLRLLNSQMSAVRSTYETGEKHSDGQPAIVWHMKMVDDLARSAAEWLRF